MATGTVKWFNDAKGYGFITPDDGSEDLCAHFSAMNMSGFKSLKEGQKVSFDVVQGPKGQQASHIKKSGYLARPSKKAALVRLFLLASPVLVQAWRGFYLKRS